MRLIDDPAVDHDVPVAARKARREYGRHSVAAVEEAIETTLEVGDEGVPVPQAPVHPH